MDYGITQDTRNVAHQAVSRFLGLRNVVACGLGYKVSRGEQSDELSLVVSVTHKVPAAQLATRDHSPQGFRWTQDRCRRDRAHPGVRCPSDRRGSAHTTSTG